MRRKVVVGNWKMNPARIHDAVALARHVAKVDAHGIEVGVAPPGVALTAVAEALRGTHVQVFGQDVHWQPEGAYTGQISALMLKGLATGTIVGHSEVRRDQGDDDARVAAKATEALRHGLRVVYCIGESLEQRQRGDTNAVLERQVRTLATIEKDLLTADDRTYRLAIAYEPIWAIGTGLPATGEQASAAIRKIREDLAWLGLASDAIGVLYGGSVSAASVGEFARAEGVDGALVGGASLKAEEFAAIVAAFR